MLRIIREFVAYINKYVNLNMLLQMCAQKACIYCERENRQASTEWMALQRNRIFMNQGRALAARAAPGMMMLMEAKGDDGNHPDNIY